MAIPDSRPSAAMHPELAGGTWRHPKARGHGLQCRSRRLNPPLRWLPSPTLSWRPTLKIRRGTAGPCPPSHPRSPGEGNGNPFQNCCLKNCMHRGAWRAAARGVTEPDTTERLTHTHLGHWVYYLLYCQETGIDQLPYLAPKYRSSC